MPDAALADERPVLPLTVYRKDSGSVPSPQ
jgi:hypothetical protein